MVGSVIAVLATVGAGSAFGVGRSTTLTDAQWQHALAQVRAPGSGCYHASYPSLAWHANPCGVAPPVPFAPGAVATTKSPASPAVIGDGTDYSAVVSGTLSEATGSFTGVTSKTTETSLGQANSFSLQLNSQFFSTPVCAKATKPASCLGWEQFIYSTSINAVFMQYWLIDYGNSCPKGYFSFSGDCYTNSSTSTFADGPLTAKGLASIALAGTATNGGNDAVALSDGGGQATLVSKTDKTLDLAKVWNTTEFNVFGDGNGSRATFGKKTTIDADTALDASSNSAPTCVDEGFTAETNNLDMTTTPAIAPQVSPTMVFKQTDTTAKKASCAVAAGGGAAQR